MEQVDRRVRRTKKSLKDALIALVLEKEYDEITIQELTDRADIGYRTFFRHYSDKDQLLMDVMSTTMTELRELMAPPTLELYTPSEFKAAYIKDSVVLFQYVQENSDLFRVLLRSERTIIESVMAFVCQEFMTTFGSLGEPDIPIAITANHMVWATLGLVRWWLDSDMSNSPVVMGEYMVRLVVQPILDIILQSSSK